MPGGEARDRARRDGATQHVLRRLVGVGVEHGVAAVELDDVDAGGVTQPPQIPGGEEFEAAPGVLRAQLNKAEVTELVYQTFVFHNICAREWYEPQQFASLGLARVELLNAKGDQGFAFDTRGNVCTEMGRLGKNFRTFISQYTVACTASGCPPQR